MSTTQKGMNESLRNTLESCELKSKTKKETYTS